MKKCLQIILLLCLSVAAGLVQAQQIEVGAQTHALSLTGHLWASPAPAPDMAPQEALALYRGGGFQKLPGNLGRGYRSDEVWLAFDLKTSLEVPSIWIAQVAPGYLDHVMAYQVDGAGEITLLGHAGDQIPFGQLSFPALSPSFALQLPPNASTTVLLHIQTTSTQAAMVTLYRGAQYPAVQLAEGLLLGFIFTISLVLLMLSLGLFALHRDLVYLSWMLLVLLTAGQWFTLDGLAYRYVDWTDQHHINTVTKVLGVWIMGAHTVLISTFFKFKRLHRGFYCVLMVWAVGAALGGTLGILLDYPMLVTFIWMASFPLAASGFIAIGLQMLRRQPESLWHGPMMMLFLIASVLNMAAVQGLISFTAVTFYSWQMAGFLNLLSLQTAMFMRARQSYRHHTQDRIRLMEQLKRHNQQLEEQVHARTQSLSTALRDVQQAEAGQRQLLSMASHEFRTPAAMIKASLDSLAFLKDHIAPEVATRLTNMRLASARLLELTNNLINQDRLLDLALKPTLHRVELGPLVSEVLARYPEPIHSVLPPKPVRVHADATLLSIALHNLIDNALRHSNHTTPGLDTGLPGVTVSLCVLAGWVELQVADDGPGIADADKQKVFERFHAIPSHRRSADQAGSAQPSSGLGLAIVQSIAHAHSGQALVRDNLPQGAVLVMRWPITTPPAP